MNTSKDSIPDGTYYIHPEGETWEVAIFRNGRCVTHSYQDVQASHDAAGNFHAGLGPDDTDVYVDDELADKILRVLWEETVDLVDLEMVHVTRAIVPDGAYFLHYEDGEWDVAIYEDGRRKTDSSEHTPRESDVDVDDDIADAILKQLLGENYYFNSNSVTRVTRQGE